MSTPWVSRLSRGLSLFPKVVEELATRDAGDIVVFGGGVIPQADIDELKTAGLAEVFTPGAGLDDIASWVAEHVPARV